MRSHSYLLTLRTVLLAAPKLQGVDSIGLVCSYSFNQKEGLASTVMYLCLHMYV